LAHSTRNKKKEKNTKTYDLTLAAVFCAIISVARIFSYIVPPIRTMLGFIIISGAYFGPTKAATIGVVSILVSNCFLGHGLWTIFQIIAVLIIGFISGIFKKEKLRKNKILLFTWSIFSVFIYSFIMLGYFFLNTKLSSISATAAYFISGIPKDIFHVVSTFFAIKFFFDPIGKLLEKFYKL
jgi:energy-coupling factor transport system substrate-specific component